MFTRVCDVRCGVVMIETLDTSSEAWRFECECRHVLNLQVRGARRQYLDGVKKVRGEAAALRLEDGVRAMMEVRRGANVLAGESGD
jgi:hypothetical protein